MAHDVVWLAGGRGSVQTAAEPPLSYFGRFFAALPTFQLEYFMQPAGRFLAASLGLGAVALHGERAAAQTYDAFKQFSIKDNPSETWTYVAAGQKLTDKITICDEIKKLNCWTNGGTSFPNTAAAEANKTGAQRPICRRDAAGELPRS